MTYKERCPFCSNDLSQRSEDENCNNCWATPDEIEKGKEDKT